MGPRHRVVCSLGSLAPAPEKEWLALARKIENALTGQKSFEPDARVDEIVKRIKKAEEEPQIRSQPESEKPAADPSDLVSIHTDRVKIEDVREAGPVHAAHQMWQKIGVG